MTDVERLKRPSTPRPIGSVQRLRWVVAPALALAAVCSYAVLGSASLASAGNLASDKAQAASLYAQLQTKGGQISALGQQWDADQQRVNQLATQVTQTREAIAQDRSKVSSDRSVLQAEAINAYVNSSAVASTNPLFATNANQLGATSVYNQVAEGNLSGSVASLTNAQQTLAADQNQLRQALTSEQQTTAAAQAAYNEAVSEQHQLNTELAQANAQVHTDLVQVQAAATVAATATFTQTLRNPPVNQSFPAPPPDSRASIAVDFALGMLGVPYVWGGASRSGVDCSGLVMLAWGAAGVSLPHYSGAQMADSTPVPVADLQPGDLLFYGPGGDEHVAMYIGNGEMIEAPYTGEHVWITPVRLGAGFAGAGRP